jgi:peptidoglycan/xylan/chitin deacetylase (PgdA/CDA1 family)
MRGTRSGVATSRYVFYRLLVPCILLGWMLSACTPSTPASPTPTQTSGKPQATLVSLTFDDGNADNFASAAVLKQYGLHATFYIPSGLVGNKGFMTWDQLQSLQNDGNEIGGHTLDHLKLGGLDPATLRHEICDDRRNLMDHGFDPVSFAYPFGNYDQQVRQMVMDCGYSDARTIRGGPENTSPSDPYALLAFPYVVADTSLDKLERYVGGTRKEGGGWVIFIFHHVCDSCDYYSVKLDVMNKYISWLAEQQSYGHIKVETVGQVVSASASH